MIIKYSPWMILVSFIIGLMIIFPSCTSTRLVLLDQETKQEKTEPLYNPTELEIERYKVMCRTFGACEVKITDISFLERIRETAERKEAGKK